MVAPVSRRQPCRVAPRSNDLPILPTAPTALPTSAHPVRRTLARHWRIGLAAALVAGVTLSPVDALAQARRQSAATATPAATPTATPTLQATSTPDTASALDATPPAQDASARSEERRVGKECR